MTNYGPGLLTPPQEKEEIFPYRRVWKSLVVESGLLFAITLSLYFTLVIFDLNFPVNIQLILNLILALLPILLWFLFSWRPEKHVLEPRSQLLTVVVITGLTTSAIGIPLITNFLQVDKWLPLSSALERILGYAVTVGSVQEIIKYLVLRYTIWPQNIRIRQDGIAYSIAAGIGYATVLNIHFITLYSSAPSDIVAQQVFTNYALLIVTSIIMGYGLAEVRFSNPNPAFLSFVIIVAISINGIAIPIRAGLVNASFSLAGSAPRTFLGIGFSAVLFIVISIIIMFLLRNAERRNEEARSSMEM